MSPAPRFERYRWAGGEEWMMRFGPPDGPQVIAALPLFEEANRTRAFVVTLLRLLGERGIGSALPDLPGQGESLIATETVSLMQMREAHDGAVAHLRVGEVYALGVRSGAMLDSMSLCSGRWYLSPQDGASLLRELTRIKQAEMGHPLPPVWYFDGTLAGEAPDPPVAVAGNLVAPDLLTELSGALTFDSGSGLPQRTVRLRGDPRPADRVIDTGPLWRRAEPDNDPALAQILASDIAEWIASCGA